MKTRKPASPHIITRAASKILQKPRKGTVGVKRARDKPERTSREPEHASSKPDLTAPMVPRKQERKTKRRPRTFPPAKPAVRRQIIPTVSSRRSTSRDVQTFIIQALDTRWNEYLVCLKRYQETASGKSVHDLRVSIRRLTTTIDLIDRFNPDNIVRQARVKLKTQLSDLSLLRDVHVEMVRVRRFLKELPEMKAFYEELRTRESKYLKSAKKIPWKSDRRFIETAINRAKIRLNARRATTSVEDSRKIVDAAMDVSFDNLSKKLENVTPTDYSSIHRVRLAFKPVRYTLEMLQPVLGLDVRQVRTATFLARLMGQIQDLEVLMKDLVEFKWKQDNVLGAVMEIWLELERRKIDATQRFLKSIPKFGSIWKPVIHEQAAFAPVSSKTLFILRHGIAVTRGDASYPLDSDRPLTPKGMKRMRRIAKGMRHMKVGFDLLLTSPYRRALETAFIVGREYGAGHIIQTSQALRAEVLPEEVIRSLQEKYSPCRRLLLVGHEPQLSALISTLTSGGASARPLLKKGGLCKLEVEKLQAGKCATLAWLLMPRQLINIS